MRTALPVAAIAAATLVAGTAFAYDLRPELWVTDGAINATHVNGNKLYIGGSFNYVGPFTGPAATVFPGTGALAPGFPLIEANTPDQPVVKAIVPDGVGGWYIGGYFHKVGGIARNHLVHINSAGGVITGFNPNPSNEVTCLALDGGRLFVGGGFTSIGGQPRTRLAQVLASTGLASSFNPNPNGAVNALIMDPNGFLVVGGAFTSISGQPRGRIAIYDASPVLMPWDPNANGPVNTFATDGTQLFVGGLYSSIGGVGRNWLSALDLLSETVTAWNPGPGVGSGSGITSIAQDALGIVYVAGSFPTMGGTPRTFVAAVDGATGVLQPWNPNPNQLVRALAVEGTTVFMGGEFTTVAGQGRMRMAAVDISGALMPFTMHAAHGGSGSTVTVYSLASDGTVLYIGGNLTTIGGQLRTNAAALDLTTGVATSWNPAPNNVVRAFASDATRLFVGGTFTTSSGVARSRIAAYDPSTGSLLPWNFTGIGGITNSVLTLALSGNSLYAGGSFLFAGPTSRPSMAAFDANTAALLPWNPNAGGGQTLALAASGSLVYAGGSFTILNGQSRNFIAALDGTTGIPTAWNPGANNQVNTLLVDGNTVYAGGFFTTAAGQPRNRIAALDATTGAATAWNPGANGQVSALAKNSTAVYAGGSFTQLDGPLRNFVGAVDATTGVATGLNVSPVTTVNALALANGTLYAGGAFPSIDQTLRSYLAGVVTAPTTASLASTPNPSAPGQLVTITATLSPGTATGTVTFFDGATVLGTGTLSGGVATFAISTLALGAHPLTAGYSGDANHQPCSAPTYIHEVKIPTTNTLASSPNPSFVGQDVTLTATVAPASASGTVTFYDGASPLGTGAVVAGQATLLTSALAFGSHSLTASYGGDGGHFTSTSAALSHDVTNLTITASSGANGAVTPDGATNVAYGGSQAYTITPDACFAVADVLVDGASVGAVTTYTFTNVTAAHTISATFVAIGSYAVVASAGAGGSITPPGSTDVACGTDQTYTIAADACHAIADVLVDGVSVGAVTSYTFTNVTTTHTISATFSALGPYAIVASAGTGGSITPPGSTDVACGADQAYTIEPADCYVVADVLVDGVSVGAVTSYTFTNVTATHTIAVTFSGVGPHTITASAGAGGSISPDGSFSAGCGGDQSFTITPDGCHVIADVLVDGVSVGAVSSYTFSNVTATHTIEASFTAVAPSTITASAGAGGSISPDGGVSVACGANQSFTITAASGYTIADVLVDGVSVGAVASHTFTNVTANHTIAASFVSSGVLTAAITGPAAGAIFAVNTSVAFTGTFGGDGPGRTHTATWTIDNTIVAGTVNELAGTVTANRTFTTPGVYNVKLKVMNDLGASVTVTQVGGNDAMIIVYDPSSGFVTGGGWMNSPPGAYVANPVLEGKAQFGFVSKYKSGGSLPTGETTYNLKFTGFEFNGTSYDWLVVTPPKAQCRGTGKVNGAGNFGFLLTILDGDIVTPTTTDRIRMKIWDKATNAVVYDNQPAAPDTTTPTNAIGGGSVIIHINKSGGGGGNQQPASFFPGDGSTPVDFALRPSFPNPTHGESGITFELPEASEARLTVFDLQGRLVADLVDDVFGPGRYSMSWNGRGRTGESIGAGVYFYRFSARAVAGEKRYAMVRRFVIMK